MTTITTDPYIMVRDGVLPPEFCKHIIEKFEKDSRKSDGVTGEGVNKIIKDSIDLNITPCPEWSHEDGIISNSLTNLFLDYVDHVNEHIVVYNRTTNDATYISVCDTGSGRDQVDSGYQIQKTQPGCGYIWHNDFELNPQYGIRHLTFIFYLNDVEEGWTQFYNGDQVQPVTGRAMIFPATWTYLHQGYPPKQTKYICTGWIHESLEKLNNEKKSN